MTPPLSQAEIARFRSLKKVLVVLLLLFRLDRPATGSEVAALLRLNRETARNYLRRLAALGYAAQAPFGWTITPAGKGLFLPPGEAGSPPSSEALVVSVEEDSDPYLPILTTTIRGGKTASRRGKSASAGEGAAAGLDPAILEAFHAAGILLNRRTRALARQPWITPEYIRDHHARLKALGKGENAGLLITILESAQPVPRPASERDPNDYISGKYAEFIEH